MQILKSTTFVFLSILSFAILILAFIPIFFPIVVVLAGSLSILMGLLLWRAQNKGEFIKQDATGPVARVESRILRRSILAVGISVLLYCILWIWTQFFYILPLKESQEPFRQDSQSTRNGGR